LPSDAPRDVTDLLTRWRSGDRRALDDLMPVVYEELRLLARHYLRNEPSDHTLQSTALVHEAYVRLVGQKTPDWQGRTHFYGVAARLMRQILVDHARRRHADKRGGNAITLTIDERIVGSGREEVDLLALDEALNRLAEHSSQESQIVELRFFAGLSIDETAEVLGVSPATVKRGWTIARAWLFREMKGNEAR
jgi:RNA polymerase sigma factor (TIGR02999 family)